MTRPELGPLFGLRLRTERLELRLPDEAERVELGELARRGVHPPEEMPFAVPWTDRAGEPDFVDGFVAFHREALDSWTPERWSLNLAVWERGRLAGSQGIGAERFALRRTVETGSWLGREFQGRGIGTEMRAAVLELAFAGLGARWAESGAIEGNLASARVSEKLGYAVWGEHTIAPRGTPVRHANLRLTRIRWLEAARPEVEVSGIEPCLALFGAA